MTGAEFLLLILLTAAVAAGSVDFGHRRRDPPVLTLAVCAVARTCLGIQFGFPALLRMVEWDSSRILAGQWWRLFSALFFQDGWLVGGVTNVAVLLLVGSLAEQVLGRVAWLAAYGAGVLVRAGMDRRPRRRLSINRLS